MMRTIRCLVSGKVQGVWFRASARDQAVRLGISGSAVNLADGRVEVIACGDAKQLQRLKEWLHEGPSGARVTGVSCEGISRQNCVGFEIG